MLIVPFRAWEQQLSFRLSRNLSGPRDSRQYRTNLLEFLQSKDLLRALDKEEFFGSLIEAHIFEEVLSNACGLSWQEDKFPAPKILEF